MYEIYIKVECPVCHAKKNIGCSKKKGEESSFLHMPRVGLAKKRFKEELEIHQADNFYPLQDMLRDEKSLRWKKAAYSRIDHHHAPTIDRITLEIEVLRNEILGVKEPHELQTSRDVETTNVNGRGLSLITETQNLMTDFAQQESMIYASFSIGDFTDYSRRKPVKKDRRK